MATSGSADWTQTRNTIINAALRRIGVLSQGDSPTAEQLVDAAEVLNRMVKEWQNDHVYLWTVEWKTKTFSAASEVTGTDSNIYTCIRGHTSANASKPITGADYTSYWYKRGSTGGVWATSTAYTSLGDFDVEDSDTYGIEKAFMRKDNEDHPIEIISFDEYMDIADKYNESSIPTKLAFHKALTPHIYLYPQLDGTSNVLHYMRIRLLEDFDAAANNPDAPVKWIGPIIKGLASELAPEYSLPFAERKALYDEAQIAIAKAKRGDTRVDSEDFIVGAY